MPVPATLTTEPDVARNEIPPRVASLPDNYALIQDAHMVSLWDNYDDAVREGYRVFGTEPFFIRPLPAFNPNGMGSEA